MNTQIQHSTLIKDLGEGLILRRATPADADALAEFNSTIHSDKPDQPDERLGAWTRDLLTRPHPTFQPGDFTVVEEKQSGRIVSSLNLISQTWQYGGLADFGVGRIELVGTLAEYRKRGLVREQMNLAHAWSAERGEMIQAITGIPFYYRQFGYEMAMELDAGRAGFESTLPPAKGDEPYNLRPATLDDIPFLMEVYDYGSRRNGTRCLRDAEIWRYELIGLSEKNVTRLETLIIERALDGVPIGYLRHNWDTWENGLAAWDYELKPGVSWLAVSPGVARYLWKRGNEIHEKKGRRATFWGFWLGAQHPVYETLRDRLPRDRTANPYAWYIRIPDLKKFILHIGGVLEQRLANSIASGYSGLIRINRYRTILALTFLDGRLIEVDETPRDARDWGDLGLPGLTLYQMIFGYRSFDELRAAFPDVYMDNDEARVVFSILFPKQPARVIPIA